MNRPKLFARVSLAVIILGMSSAARAQEPPKPSDEMKALAAEVGTWDATIKSYVGGPEAEPVVSKGVETNELMAGGLWMISKFTGDIGGLPFEGRGIFGFDPVKKKYVGTWVDSMNPTISQLEGTYDAKTKTVTYTGDGVDPNSGTKYTQKMVTTMKPDGTRHFTLYMAFGPDAPETKFMEAIYTKKK